MKNRIVCVTIFILLTFCVTAHSAYWESVVTKVGLISPIPYSDFGRILVQFDLPSQLNGAIIDYAELIFTATPDTGNSYICLMGAYPLTKNWDSNNLSWTSGWTNSGGDYTDSIYSTCVIRTSLDKVTRIDITDMVQIWLDSSLVNYGLMVMPLEDSNRFLKLHTTPSLGQDVMAKVRIFYTREVGD